LIVSSREKCGPEFGFAISALSVEEGHEVRGSLGYPRALGSKMFQGVVHFAV